MATLILPLSVAEATLEEVGGKGAALARLAQAGLPVPGGFHVTTEAYRRFVAANQMQAAIVAAAREASPTDPASQERASDRIRELFAGGALPDDVAAAIREAYWTLGAGVAVAVRSSATAEDLPEMSFAGQQETYLNVRGAAAVADAVRRCWASLWTARAIGYRARQGIAPEDVTLAVVVQELVTADASGVLFTANPVTGARDEMLVNAAWGLGEAVVGGEVTPDTMSVEKATGAIREQAVAAKDVMTTLTPNGTSTEPVPAERRSEPVLTPDDAAELARLGRRIEQLWGQPMDVEWAKRDGRIFILQARPITALPELSVGAPPSPEEWQVPNPRASYYRSSVIELLPDPLSPLFASLGLPAWNDAMTELLDRYGAAGMMDDMLTVVNGYAYYEITFTPAQIAQLPVLTVRAIPILAKAYDRWANGAQRIYAAVARRWEAEDLARAPATHLVAGAHEIVGEAARHYLAVQSGILPVAYMSEGAFSALYDRLLKHPSDPPALTFFLGYESAPIRAEESLYELAIWARAHESLKAFLASTPGTQIASALGGDAPPTDVEREAWEEFRQRFATHLQGFGYAIYDLDFAKPVPADEPGPLLEALKFFLSGQAADPRERRAAAAAQREQATADLLGRPLGALIRRLLEAAQRFAPLREDALAEVGRGWPVLRRMLLELGRRLVAARAIERSDDVFWLTYDELRTTAAQLEAIAGVEPHGPVVAERRVVWEQQRQSTPPAALPIEGGARFLGMDFSRWLPARMEQAAGDVVAGIGTSPGKITGPARVIHGPEEFDQMQPGEILVAKITTPAWTPLFALAAGVVTDVGGPLSHSSIVAREYHIPAVLGTGVATARIHSGQRITVDGAAGTVDLAA